MAQFPRICGGIFPSVFFTNSFRKSPFRSISRTALILVALSLYPFGPKEGGLFPAPQALDSGLLGLPGLDSGVLAPPGLDSGVVGLLGPEAFLLAPAPGKVFTMQGFVFALLRLWAERSK